MRTYNLSIPAGGSVVLDILGTFFKLISTTAAAGEITVRADTQSQDGNIGAYDLVVRVGDKPKFSAPFDKLTFFNSGAGTATAQIIAGLGDHDQDSLVGSVTATISGTVDVDQTNSVLCDSRDVGNLAAGASFDTALDATIRSRTIQADFGNTDVIWVRDTSGTANGGIALGPGDTFTINSGGVVRIRNNSAAVQAWSAFNVKG